MNFFFLRYFQDETRVVLPYVGNVSKSFQTCIYKPPVRKELLFLSPLCLLRTAVPCFFLSSWLTITPLEWKWWGIKVYWGRTHIFQGNQFHCCLIGRGKSGRVVVVDNIMFIISLVGPSETQRKEQEKRNYLHFLVTLFECHKNTS